MKLNARTPWVTLKGNKTLFVISPIYVVYFQAGTIKTDAFLLYSLKHSLCTNRKLKLIFLYNCQLQIDSKVPVVVLNIYSLTVRNLLTARELYS